MIGPALLALLGAALPAGTARYRVELGGEHVGVAEVAVRCSGAACRVTWETWLRAPAEAGGAVRSHRVAVEVDRDGHLGDRRIALVEDGRARTAAGPRGAVPATVAELVLATLAPGACLDAFDEETGARARACVRRGPPRVEAEVLGTVIELVPGPGGFPAEVLVPAQGARYRLDPGVALPADPPRLPVRVAGPEPGSGALVFCGARADPAPPRLRGPVPPPAADGESCREQTARYLAVAARSGLAGRTAVGVAWDGAGYAWHAWAELRVGGRWVPVDPSFGQAPARGPRFTLARFADGDEVARAAAARRVLACWGRAQVRVAP